MLNGIFGNMDPGKVTYSFDENLNNEIEYFMSHNSTIHQCVGLLDRFLFSNITIKGSSKLFQNYITEYFVPFFRAVLKDILTVGWSAIMLRNSKDPQTKQKIMVPETLERDVVKPTVVVDKGQVTYDVECYDYTGFNEMKGVIFLIFQGVKSIANPSLIHSPIMSLIDDYRYILQVKQFAVQAEFVRTNPTVYLMEAPSGNKPVRPPMPGTAPVAAAANTVDMTQPPVPLRDQLATRAPTRREEVFKNASKNLTDHVEFHQMQMQDNINTSVTGRYNQGKQFRPQYHNNVYVVPPGMALACPPQMPSSGIDVHALESALSSKIFKAFGIPEALVGSTSTASSNYRNLTRNSQVRNTVNMMDVVGFEATLDRYRRFFTDALVLIYDEIFSVKLDRSSIDFGAPALYHEYLGVTIGAASTNGYETEDLKHKSTASDPEPNPKGDNPTEPGEEEDEDEEDPKPPRKKKKLKK